MNIKTLRLNLFSRGFFTYCICLLSMIEGIGCYSQSAENNDIVNGGIYSWTNQISKTSDTIKKPVKWLEWGFDFRFRHEYHNNGYTLSSQKPDHEYNYQRYRERLWFLVSPTENISFKTQFSWEGRYYFKPDSKRGMNWDEVCFDNFNLKLGDINTGNFSLILGRQEIIFGDRWLIYDATSIDGSRTEFFDAARLMYNLPRQNTLVNIIPFYNFADSEKWLHPINSRNRALSEQNEKGVILYIENRSLNFAKLDGYFIYKHDDKYLPNGNNGERFVAGIRIDGNAGKHWHYTAELAPQFGEKNDNDFQAFGFNCKIEYLFKDRLNNSIRFGYEYLSGDDPDTATVESFDPLWGRRARWSELMIFTFGKENNSRNGEWTNLQRFDFGWSFKPAKKLEFLVDYMPLFANENTYRNSAGYSRDGKFRGHLICGILKFTITQNLNAYLWSEFFLPGDYYSADRRDLATFFRTQLFYTF